jgi:hypothetical protein
MAASPGTAFTRADAAQRAREPANLASIVTMSLPCGVVVSAQVSPREWELTGDRWEDYYW